MARIDWVHRRLENWALWHERMNAGGLGFATRSSFLADPSDRGQRDARMPVDEVEAGITDEAVQALKLGKGHLYETLALLYLRGMGVRETARQMGRAESTIHAQLGQADVLLAAWFVERQRRKDAEAEELRRQLAAARDAQRLRGSFTA